MTGRRKLPPVTDPLASPLLYDQAVEERLVGWLILHPERAEEACQRLRTEHFHGTAARGVMAAVLALVRDRRRPHADAVAAELRRQEVAGERPEASAFDVARLLDGLPRGGTWEDYAERVREAAQRRAAFYALEQARSGLATETDFVKARDAVYRALDLSDDPHSPAESDSWTVTVNALSQYLDGDKVLPPVATGIAGMDQLMDGGVARAALTIIGARTSVGKTALAGTVAMNMARAGQKVSFFSLEMDRLRMATRFAALLTGIPVSDWKRRVISGQDDRLDALLQQLPLCVDTRSRTVGAIRARAFQHRRLLGGLDAVFVDYIQLVDERMSQGEKRYEMLGRVSRGLIQLAQDLECAVFGLSQLSRDTIDKPEPDNSDLRESGNLEQDAEAIWLIYKPRDKRGRPVAGSGLKVKVSKNRSGPTGYVGVQFNPTTMRFLDEVED